MKGVKKMSKIEKRFPADTTLEQKTFLNDPKADGELYAYLLANSFGEDGETRVYKKNLPTWVEIADKVLHCKSKSTVGNHFKYLKDQGYIIDQGKYYTLPMIEKMYFKIPLDTLSFLIDVVKEPVIKTYVYLGQRNSFKPNQYVFTLKEICEHLGINYRSNYTIVQNYLIALEDFGLIKIAYFYEDKVPKMRLVDFNIKKKNLK